MALEVVLLLAVLVGQLILTGTTIYLVRKLIVPPTISQTAARPVVSPPDGAPSIPIGSGRLALQHRLAIRQRRDP